MVASGSPRLRITKIGWFKENLGHTQYRDNLCGNLVPAFWECMSADNRYSGLVLSVGISQKAQTGYGGWQFKVFFFMVQKQVFK